MNELEIKRKANDFLHKGKYQEAIAEYENLLASQKKPNPAIVNLIGDLHVKQGDFEKGFEAYLTASRTYAEEGLYHNGIAVGKKVIRLDKEQTEVYGILGQLYARQGLGMDCVKFLSEYARRMEEAGEYPAALASFAEACEILPEFPDVHASYGDMLERVDRTEDAASAFDRAAGACADREMAAEAQAYRTRAAALRGETTEPVGDGVADLMSLRNLDSGEVLAPPTREIASIGAPSAPASDRFAVFDPAKNPDIPPPPPLPGRPAAPAAPTVGPPPPPVIEVPDSVAIDLPDDFVDPASHGEIDIDAPAEEPVAGTPAEPVPEELTLEPPLEAPAEPAAAAPVEPVAGTPAGEPEGDGLMEFFEANTETPGGGEERAVIVGDDFELVREGGDVQEVINDFREATMDLLDLDDHQSHYDLGTTYMEMELFDEAAAEFEISARGPEFALPSQEMLGYCFLRKGQIDLAIRELRKGLEIEGYDERDKLGLLYNLGVASRVLDQEEEAIAYFRRILEIDPDFRDTKSRLERLVES